MKSPLMDGANCQASVKVPLPLPNHSVTQEWLAKAKSKFPSLLKSPTTKESPYPMAFRIGAWNPPFPLPKDTLKPELGTYQPTSSFPSLLKSPAATKLAPGNGWLIAMPNEAEGYLTCKKTVFDV